MKTDKKNETLPWVGIPMGFFDYENKDTFITHSNDYAFNLYFEIAKIAQNPWNLGTAVTNVALLGELVSMGIADKSQRRSSIKKVLSFMTKAGFMKVTPSEYKNDTLISIEVVKPWEIKSENKAYNRYVDVTQEFYDSCLKNPRFFRALIYAEHRMFRGQDNEGKWIIHNDEWSKALDLLSRSDINDLFEEMQALNIIDKIYGQTYQDESGQIRNEGSMYHPVRAEVREKRQKKVEVKVKGEMLEERHNRIDTMAEAMLDVTDERVFDTNLFDWSAKLDANDMYVFVTTECVVTKEFVNNRLVKIDKKKAGMRKALIDMGEKENAKRKKSLEAKALTEAMSQCYVEADLFYEADDGIDRYQLVKARREEAEAQEKARKAEEAKLEREAAREADGDDWLPF